MIFTVTKTGDLQATLELLLAFVVLLVLEEDDGVGEVDNPEVGVVGREPREYLCGQKMVFHGSFMVIEILHKLE